jgi:hypothetical protein
MFPELAKPQITKQIQKVECIHQKDINEGYGLSSLPPALIRKYGKAATNLSWQYIFLQLHDVFTLTMAMYAVITFTKQGFERP